MVNLKNKKKIFKIIFILQKKYSNQLLPSTNNILFAVKTCSKFHKDRVPVIQETWGREAKHIRYYSDSAGIIVNWEEVCG